MSPENDPRDIVDRALDAILATPGPTEPPGNVVVTIRQRIAAERPGSSGSVEADRDVDPKKSRTAWLPLVAALLLIAAGAWVAGYHAWLFRRVAGRFEFPNGTTCVYFSDGTVSIFAGAGESQ